MIEKRAEALGERMLTKTLHNGLRICLVPKEGFSKTFAMLATDFGSVDESFTLDGVRYDTPTGVAHFLEHKMFEDEDGNALQKFAETGASPNAFTSHCMTAYHFSSTDKFEKNLEILLKFVFTPYFTDENVEKEKGIIGQEIGMVNDTPVWQAINNMYAGLYHEHPVRNGIIGSVASISGITPDILYMCHKAFYSPSNMVLVVVGDADFNQICSMAEALSPRKSTDIGQRHYGTRTAPVKSRETTYKMPVALPIFMLGFKDMHLAPGESRLRRELIGEIAMRLLCGKTSALYHKLYNARLINAEFDQEYSILPEAATAICSGESRDPRKVRDEIEAELNRLAQEGADAEQFEKARRAGLGMRLRVLDDLDDYARMVVEAQFAGEDFFDFETLYNEITLEEINAFYQRLAVPGRSTLSVVSADG